MRRPITRLAYWIGMRRWPSWMKTIAAMTASAMNGIITLKTGSGLFHHGGCRSGRPETIEAKIISEIPLPMPRWVISSPIHMRSTGRRSAQRRSGRRAAALNGPMSGVPALSRTT